MIKGFVKSFFALFGVQISKINKSSGENDDFSLEHVGPLHWLKKFQIETVIDIGANIGQFADKIIAVFPNAQVYCFEPLPLVFDELANNFKENKNVKTFNIALGDAEEEMMINSNEYSPSSSLLEMLDSHKSNFEFAVKSHPTKIFVRRLDEVLTGPLTTPMLLKIDVQGYEMNVLRGGEAIVNQASVIIIETTFVSLYKGQPLFNDIYDYFTKRGFNYAGNLEQLISPKDRQILQADAIFVKLNKR